MGYYKQSQYRGDYYRGARGDLWDDILSAGGKVLGGAVGGFLGSGTPKVNPMAATSPGSIATNALMPMSQSFSGVSVGGAQGVRIGRSTATVVQRAAQQGGGGGGSRSRRMNPCNVRALRRAIRRAESFKHIAGKLLKLTHDKRHIGGFKHHKKKKA